MRHKILVFMLIIAAFWLSSCYQKEGGEVDAGRLTLATCVKADGIPWFERMRKGIARFQADNGHECFMQGPAQADAAGQVRLIEDMIAQGVDAIGVVPFSVESLEPVLKRARDSGIVVVSHEASNQKNADLIIEAFDNRAFGAHLMDHLARCMGGKGEFAVFVGSLSSKSHNEWVDGALARQKEKYPGMTLVAERIEDHDDQNTAYEKTKELLKAYPNLKGIQGSASTTAPGAALAIEEKGLQDRIAVVGVGVVSQCRQYIQSGSIKVLSLWDPADAGYVMNKLAVMLLEKEKVVDGMDLGVPGYEKIRQDPKKSNLFYGAAWVDVTRDNLGKYDF